MAGLPLPVPMARGAARPPQPAATPPFSLLQPDSRQAAGHRFAGAACVAPHFFPGSGWPRRKGEVARSALADWPDPLPAPLSPPRLMAMGRRLGPREPQGAAPPLRSTRPRPRWPQGHRGGTTSLPRSATPYLSSPSASPAVGELAGSTLQERSVGSLNQSRARTAPAQEEEARPALAGRPLPPPARQPMGRRLGLLGAAGSSSLSLSLSFFLSRSRSASLVGLPVFPLLPLFAGEWKLTMRRRAAAAVGGDVDDGLRGKNRGKARCALTARCMQCVVPPTHAQGRGLGC